MKIRTDYWPKPIPIRAFDWCAVDDDTADYDTPCGYGATEQEAVHDLLEKVHDQDR